MDYSERTLIFMFVTQCGDGRWLLVILWRRWAAAQNKVTGRRVSYLSVGLTLRTS